MSTKLQHEFGLAVIKRIVHAESKTKSRDAKKGCQLPIRRKPGEMQSSPQTWAAVVASPAPQKAQERRGQNRSTETLGTSQPSKTVNLNTTPTAMDLGDVAASTLPAGDSHD